MLKLIIILLKSLLNLNKKDINEFQNDSGSIINFMTLINILLNIYTGYQIIDKNLVLISDIKHFHTTGDNYGIYSKKSYLIITHILKLLNLLNMPLESALFFLALCKTLHSDINLLKKITLTSNNQKGKYGVLSTWIKTQIYLNQNEYPKILDLLRFPTNKDKIEFEKNCHNSSDGTQTGIKGLNYISNSCYQDSILLCLFGVSDNKLIADQLLNLPLNIDENIIKKCLKCSNNTDENIKIKQNIRSQLQHIYNYINGITNSSNSQQNKEDKNINKCTYLRASFNKCNPEGIKFSQTNTEDAGEFLLFLFDIFCIQNATKSYQTVGYNNFHDHDSKKYKGKKIYDKNDSPIITIEPTTLKTISQSNQNYNLQNFLNFASVNVQDSIFFPDKIQKPDEFYMFQYNLITLIDAPYIIFNLYRKFPGYALLNVKIIIPEFITLINGKKFNLNSIVVHTGSFHYVAYFKCNNVWFFYNDLGRYDNKHTIEFIGSYNNLISRSLYNPQTNGTIIFYSPIGNLHKN
jgi:hypothetical protein